MAHPIPIDITNIPELARIAEEVEATKTPRELKRENKTVAVIMPVKSRSSQKKPTWEHIQATFGSWNDVDAEAMIANIYRWRKEGSRPANRP
jgi:poly-gamma-glutamate capsule biosynthesis protein CapA/YwtB (metallophosphatase superfamily)